MRRPRRPEDYREYSIVERLRKREKDFKGYKGNDIAFIFPSEYRVAVSSLAFSWVRDLFGMGGLGVERFFFHESFKKFYSLESRRPLDEFRIIAFSYQFETDLPNLLEILRRRSIPLRWKERGDEHPLILIGGPVTYFNPSSVFPIADLVYSGDLEENYIELSEILKVDSKESILGEASRLDYLYIPPLGKRGKLVKFRNLDLLPPVGSILSPDGEFKGKLLIEIGRGCIRRCSFCMIGHLQKPARFVRIETLRRILKGVPSEIPLGLISATITDYPWLDELLDLLEGRSFSVSSMRADGITPRLLEMLSRNQRSFTVAPEGGTQKIRDVLMKDITDEDLERALMIGKKAGFKEVKMYFIYGLEEESEEDLLGIREIVKTALRIGYESVKVSLNPLIPKPGTPFQGRKMEDVETLEEKKKLIGESLKMKRVKVKFESVKESVFQYVIANADEKTADLLIDVFEKRGAKEMKKFVYDSFKRGEMGGDIPVRHSPGIG